MVLDFLPARIRNVIYREDLKDVYDVRLRTGYPVIVNRLGKGCYLTDNGLSESVCGAIRCDEAMIKSVVGALTEDSVYAFNEQLKNGFLVSKGGVRVGLAGECVFDCGKIVTIKNVSSLNVRIPHEIKNCSDTLYEKALKNGLCNLLIVSPPGRGKTTLLKDLVRKFNESDTSVLVIDERGEFVTCGGAHVDFVKNSDKLYAFNYAVRSLSPKIVITDELCGENDWQCVKNARDSGVTVIASCHARSLNDVKSKKEFKEGVFDCFAILSSGGLPGRIESLIKNERELL